MRRVSRLGLRARLTLLLLVAFVSLGSLFAWHLLHDRDAKIEDAKGDLLASARLLRFVSDLALALAP